MEDLGWTIKLTGGYVMLIQLATSLNSISVQCKQKDCFAWCFRVFITIKQKSILNSLIYNVQ